MEFVFCSNFHPVNAPIAQVMEYLNFIGRTRNITASSVSTDGDGSHQTFMWNFQSRRIVA
jgi:hypothetical protein